MRVQSRVASSVRRGIRRRRIVLCAVIAGLAIAVAPASALAAYPHSYEFANEWAYPAPLPEDSFNPEELSLAPNGNLWVTSGAAFVSEYTTQGAFVRRFAEEASLSRIDDIAAGPEALWIRGWNNTVKKLTLGGVDAGVVLAGHPAAFDKVSAISVDASGCVYVADHGGTTGYKMQVTKYAPDGSYITSFGTHGTTNDNWLWSASSIAIAPNWDVYVTDWLGQYVRRYTPNATRTSYTPAGRWKDVRPLYQGSESVDVDSLGNVFVLYGDTKSVVKYGSTGRVLASWGAEGTGDGQFTTPRGLVVYPDGHVFVNDRDAVNVQEFRQRDLGPLTSAAGNVVVKKGKKATFKYKVDEDVSATVTVTLKVFTGSTLKATIPCGTVNQGAWQYKSWSCKLPKGTYTWKVYATDAAGHAQRSIASKKLTVK